MKNTPENYFKVKNFVKSHPVGSHIIVYGEFICGDFYFDYKDKNFQNFILGKISKLRDDCSAFEVEVYTGDQVVELYVDVSKIYEVLS